MWMREANWDGGSLHTVVLILGPGNECINSLLVQNLLTFCRLVPVAERGLDLVPTLSAHKWCALRKHPGIQECYRTLSNPNLQIQSLYKRN